MYSIYKPGLKARALWDIGYAVLLLIISNLQAKKHKTTLI